MRSVVQHLFCRNHVPVESFTNQPDMLTHVGRDSMNQNYHKTTLRKLTLQWNINYSSMGCIFHVSFFWSYLCCLKVPVMLLQFTMLFLCGCAKKTCLDGTNLRSVTQTCFEKTSGNQETHDFFWAPNFEAHTHTHIKFKMKKNIK